MCVIKKVGVSMRSKNKRRVRERRDCRRNISCRSHTKITYEGVFAFPSGLTNSLQDGICTHSCFPITAKLVLNDLDRRPVCVGDSKRRIQRLLEFMARYE
jgi:hypothetical protein